MRTTRFEPRRRTRGGATAGARTLAVTAACALALGFGASGATAEEDAVPERNSVRIGANSLEPETIRVPAGEIPSFHNEEEHVAYVTFPDSLAETLACGNEDVRPAFHPDGRGRLVSTPIRSLPFALPCALPAGTYPFEVRLVKAHGPPGALIGTPKSSPTDLTLEGTIIVE